MGPSSRRGQSQRCTGASGDKGRVAKKKNVAFRLADAAVDEVNEKGNEKRGNLGRLFTLLETKDKI